MTEPAPIEGYEPPPARELAGIEAPADTDPLTEDGLPFLNVANWDGAGATVADKITGAAESFAGSLGVVIVPARLGAGADGQPGVPTDLVIPPSVTVIDHRGDHGTITNQYVKGGVHYARVFGENLAEEPDVGSDNGSTLSIDALLEAGEGGLSPIPYGENTALYAGLQRQVGSTRSGWAANLVFTTYEPPSDQMSSYGLEIDLSNNSGVDATADTPLDGIVVLAAGTDNSRFGLWIANSGGAKYLKGIVIGAVVTDVGLDIGAGMDYGIYTQSGVNIEGVTGRPGLVLRPPANDGASQIRGTDAAGNGEVWAIGNDGRAAFGDTRTRDLTATRGGAGAGSGVIYFGEGASHYLYFDGTSIESTQKWKWNAANAVAGSAIPANANRWFQIVGDDGLVYAIPGVIL